MKIKVGDEEVELKASDLTVSDTSLNVFLTEFAAKYAYYNRCWAKAQYIQHITEDQLDIAASEKFQWYKENEGGSDKLVDAKVKTNEHVVKARKTARNAKYVCQLLFTYLRALDKAHENALNLGYNIRKEMDKIFPQHVATKEHLNPDDEVAKLFEPAEASSDEE